MMKKSKAKIAVTIPFIDIRKIESLVNCVRSFINQTFSANEIIVVGAKEDIGGLMEHFTQDELKRVKIVFSRCEKNEARNIGFRKANSDFVIFADHDMRAEKKLLEVCARESIKYDVLFIPEKGAGGNFWEECRKLQKKLVRLDFDTVSPRFLKKGLFGRDEDPFDSKFGGLDEWGFSFNLDRRKVKKGLAHGSFVIIEEDNLTLLKEVKSKFLKGLWFKNFYQMDRSEAWRRVDPVKRGILFYPRHIKYFFRYPVLFLGLLFFKTVALISFFLGAFVGYFYKQNRERVKWDIRSIYDKDSNFYVEKMFEGSRWGRYVDRVEKEAVKEIWIEGDEDKLKNQVVLDLGVGPGRWSKFFLKLGFKKVVGLDISPKMIKKVNMNINEKGFSGVVGDVEKLSFLSQSFDRVFCFRVFKYLPDPQKAISEIVRVSKKGAKILIEISNYNIQNRVFKILSYFVPLWYFRRANFYSIKQFKKILDGFGNIKIEKISPLFILPSVNLLGKFGDRIYNFSIFCDNLLMKIVPKNLFVRSWIFSMSKKKV